jgi:hypothetical protein
MFMCISATDCLFGSRPFDEDEKPPSLRRPADLGSIRETAAWLNVDVGDPMEAFTRVR